MREKIVKGFQILLGKIFFTLECWSFPSTLKQFNSASKIIVFNAKRPFGKSQQSDLLETGHFSSPGGGVGVGGFYGDHVTLIRNRSDNQWSLTECKGWGVYRKLTANKGDC